MDIVQRWLTPGRAQILFWLTVVVVAVLAFMPGPEVPVTTGWDKSNHALAFFVLALLASLSWPRRAWWQPALALVGYGIVIEIVQGFVGRDSSALDVLADSTGIAIEVVLWLLAVRTRAAAD